MAYVDIESKVMECMWISTTMFCENWLMMMLCDAGMWWSRRMKGGEGYRQCRWIVWTARHCHPPFYRKWAVCGTSPGVLESKSHKKYSLATPSTAVVWLWGSWPDKIRQGSYSGCVGLRGRPSQTHSCVLHMSSSFVSDPQVSGRAVFCGYRFGSCSTSTG